MDSDPSTETSTPPPARCSRCGCERDRPGQSYCRACHAAYMRERSKRLTRAAHLVKKFGLSVSVEQFDSRVRSVQTDD